MKTARDSKEFCAAITDLSKAFDYLPRPLSHCMLMDSIETRLSLSNKNLIDKILKILWLP